MSRRLFLLACFNVSFDYKYIFFIYVIAGIGRQIQLFFTKLFIRPQPLNCLSDLMHRCKLYEIEIYQLQDFLSISISAPSDKSVQHPGSDRLINSVLINRSLYTIGMEWDGMQSKYTVLQILL